MHIKKKPFLYARVQDRVEKLKTEQVGDEDGVELSCYHSGFQIIP